MEGASRSEHPLPGGNFDADAVRVGNTVRRRAGPWTPAVHSLLRHLIDWDFARPGSRIWDLAWAAHTWVPLWDEEGCVGVGWPTPPDRAYRLRLLCDAYGLADRVPVLPALRARVRGTAEWIEAGAAARDPVLVRLLSEGHAQGYRRAASHLETIDGELRAALR